MALENYILRNPHGSPHNKIPFIFALIDANGTLQTIPFPPSEVSPGVDLNGKDPTNTVYGIELMVNPSTLSSNLSKLMTRQQSMTSYVEDHWGEELDTITIQGHTAAFVTGGATGGTDIYSIRLSQGNSFLRDYLKNFKRSPSIEEPAGLVGVTVSERRNSLSYIQFKRLIDIIRINGCMFDSSGLIKRRYYVMVSFGNASYKGFFENIDVTEIAADPYRYQYTITFKSEETLYSYINRGTDVQ